MEKTRVWSGAEFFDERVKRAEGGTVKWGKRAGEGGNMGREKFQGTIISKVGLTTEGGRR